MSLDSQHPSENTPITWTINELLCNDDQAHISQIIERT